MVKLNPESLPKLIAKQQKLMGEKLALRASIDKELQWMDAKLSALQVYREELVRAQRAQDSDGIALVRGAILELLDMPTPGTIDRPLTFPRTRRSRAATGQKRGKGSRTS
jgi:hypothetical protein